MHSLCAGAVWNRAACWTISPASSNPKPYLKREGNSFQCLCSPFNMWTTGWSILKMRVLTEILPAMTGPRLRSAVCATCDCLEDQFWTIRYLAACNQTSLFILYRTNLSAKVTMANPEVAPAAWPPHVLVPSPPLSCLLLYHLLMCRLNHPLSSLLFALSFPERSSAQHSSLLLHFQLSHRNFLPQNSLFPLNWWCNRHSP